jgi:DNA (cytosine-5)-methyltransferase 1
VRDLALLLNDLFCGAGGIALGFKQAGFKIAGAWDWDKYAIQSYKANIGDHVQQADISQMTWQDMPAAEGWSFGFPCQDLSIAGQQKGMITQCEELNCLKQFPLRDVDDGKCPFCSSTRVKALTRSGLFFEVMRLLSETRTNAPDQMPLFIMAENVKPLGQYLGTLEREYKRVGYRMYAQLFNSKYWGVPQSRERYYVVGIREDIADQVNYIHPTEQTAIISRLHSILEPQVAEKYYMRDEKAQQIIQAAQERMKLLYPTLQELQTVYTDKDGCAYCCDANYFKGTSPNDVGSGRRTQVFEYDADLFGYGEVAASSEQGKPKIEIVGMLDVKGKDQWRRVFSVDGLAPTLTAVQGGLQEAKIFDPSVFRVRKLTPREYARLQGFPDTYKQVVSDSQMYRQLGNSVTVPLVAAIANTIKEALGRVKQ